MEMQQQEFSLAAVAAGARQNLTYEPLAVLLDDYCKQQGISQGELRRKLSADPKDVMSEASLRRLSLVTVNVSALIEVLIEALALATLKGAA